MEVDHKILKQAQRSNTSSNVVPEAQEARLKAGKVDGKADSELRSTLFPENQNAKSKYPESEGLLKAFRRYLKEAGHKNEYTWLLARSMEILFETFSFDEIVAIHESGDHSRFYRCFQGNYSEEHIKNLSLGPKRFFKFLAMKKLLGGHKLNPYLNEQEVESFYQYTMSLGYRHDYALRMCIVPRDLLLGQSLEFVCSQITNPSYEENYLARIRKDCGDSKFHCCRSGYRRFREYLYESGKIESVSVGPIFQGPFVDFEKCLHEFITIEKKYSLRWAKFHRITFSKLKAFLISKNIETLQALNAELILKFFQEYKLNICHKGALRGVLKLMYRNGFVGLDLSFLVITKSPRSSEVRKYLCQSDIEQLLESLPKSNVRNLRDYAMFLLMARMGLRPGELSSLKLKDIDWVRGEIRIVGKDEKVSRLPFPQDVGDAILTYLKISTRSDDPSLFVSTKAPFARYQSVRKLRKALKRAYEETGVERPTKQVRLNVFRHSFATNALNRGVPMLVVRDLLRHEHIETTMIYAKYNLNSIRPYKPDWPEAQ